MNILHVIASLAPRYGGPSKACFEMARALARKGHETAIFTTDAGAPPGAPAPSRQPVHRAGVTVHTFAAVFPRFWKTSPGLARALWRAIPAADVVHIHSLYLFHDLAAYLLCRHFRVPYLLRPHGTLDPFLYRRHRLRKKMMEMLFQNRMLKHAAAIHYTSEEEKRLAAPFAGSAPGLVIPNGIDPQEYDLHFPPGAFRARHPETAGKTVLLFMGRLNFKKGLDILAESFIRLSRERADLHLVLAGPDDEGEGGKLRRALLSAGLDGRFTFAGMLQDEDKLAALRDADLFVLPSYSENFGLAVVEAMACALPVAITRAVNIYADIEKAGAGCASEPRADDFTELLRIMLAMSPEERRAMGVRGRTLAATRFSWESITPLLEQAYRDIAGQRP